VRRGATLKSAPEFKRATGEAGQASLRDASLLGFVVPWAEASRLLSCHRYAMESQAMCSPFLKTIRADLGRRLHFLGLCEKIHKFNLPRFCMAIRFLRRSGTRL